ncbi:MAG: hypothetical protein ACQEWV_11170 [Bacillota bacterium]
MKKLKKLLSILLIGFMLTMLGITSAYAENISNEKFLFAGVFNTCDEEVVFEGNIHYIENITSNGNGGYHVKIQWNYVNVKGYGLTSGVSYVLKASDTIVLNVKAGITQSGTFSSHAIAQGPSSDFLVHGTYHITIDADGNVVTEVTQLKASCFES